MHHPLVVLALSALALFDSPDDAPCDAYKAMRSLGEGAWATVKVWRDSSRTVEKVPRVGAGPDSFWFAVPNDPIKPVRLHVRRCVGDSCSKNSNDVIAARPAAADPQEVPPYTFFLQRPSIHPTCFTEPRTAVRKILSWSLEPGDTGPYKIVSKDYAQQALQDDICQIFQYNWRFGARIECP